MNDSHKAKLVNIPGHRNLWAPLMSIFVKYTAESVSVMVSVAQLLCLKKNGPAADVEYSKSHPGQTGCF